MGMERLDGSNEMMGILCVGTRRGGQREMEEGSKEKSFMSWVLLSRQSKTSAHQTHAGREGDYQTWPGRARARAAPSSTPSADLLPHSANVTSAFSGAGGLAGWRLECFEKTLGRETEGQSWN